jgi:hypothetical protein|mmetsp:Transcript_36643/g.48115  ORF Transcript_36643/g.48115 Transcript_36643/m.48115 type:complete len:103 (-) Transcript_36643:1638-1946(-)|eukprot:CAMPEP_0185596220 /NCGR_PEP_ID=MMETSP0434-20130131/80633_1 /TAXON_ID=626734 ORGANISM="Favella taraikaensis, Strain Fe Narragansett Bay" /NCGR_SAMPLE_ID=MMETSP0434 /ASSEMBLY_ACC=CAM_ASM_000379 /LENGTH=102 /DNA_ID=CAMNT_0028224693 /DNA_START=2675 /DNA_END=2983 /DNA_ORIENTATION=-
MSAEIKLAKEMAEEREASVVLDFYETTKALEGSLVSSIIVDKTSAEYYTTILDLQLSKESSSEICKHHYCNNILRQTSKQGTNSAEQFVQDDVDSKNLVDTL